MTNYDGVWCGGTFSLSGLRISDFFLTHGLWILAYFEIDPIKR